MILIFAINIKRFMCLYAQASDMNEKGKGKNPAVFKGKRKLEEIDVPPPPYREYSKW